MIFTPEIDTQREAEEVRDILGDLRGMLKLSMRRPDITAARMVGVSRVLVMLEEFEARMGREGTAATTTLVAAAGLPQAGGDQ